MSRPSRESAARLPALPPASPACGIPQHGRPRIDAAVEKRIQTQLRAGKGILKVAREVGVGTGTVQRVQQEMKSGPFADVAA
jgi:hypothetical protein